MTLLKLEFFVHGALCVSFSGLCYFSQVAKGRSANRGECAQMCRLPYTLTDSRGSVLTENQHVLSLKDLNLSAYLADLVDAGVTSFKIEGRLKEASYVKNITAFYRSKLDKLIEGRGSMCRSSSGKTTFFFEADSEKTFARPTTDYFIRGRRQGIVSLHSPESAGKLIGTVQSIDIGFFTLKSASRLHNGDGICFFNDNDELTGVNIGLTDSLFLPVGVLNQLRRDCISSLVAERARKYPRRFSSIVPNNFPYPTTTLDYSANVVNERAAQFYRRHGVHQIEGGLELQNDATGKVVMTTRHCLKYQFDLCQGEKGGAEELYLSDGRTKYKLEFDCDNCVMKIVSP